VWQAGNPTSSEHKMTTVIVRRIRDPDYWDYVWASISRGPLPRLARPPAWAPDLGLQAAATRPGPQGREHPRSVAHVAHATQKRVRNVGGYAP